MTKPTLKERVLQANRELAANTTQVAMIIDSGELFPVVTIQGDEAVLDCGRTQLIKGEFRSVVKRVSLDKLKLFSHGVVETVPEAQVTATPQLPKPMNDLDARVEELRALGMSEEAIANRLVAEAITPQTI